MASEGDGTRELAGPSYCCSAETEDGPSDPEPKHLHLREQPRWN